MRREVHHATGGQLLQHDVVQGERLDRAAVSGLQPGRQQRPLVCLQIALQGGVDAGKHVVGHDVGEETRAGRD